MCHRALVKIVLVEGQVQDHRIDQGQVFRLKKCSEQKGLSCTHEGAVEALRGQWRTGNRAENLQDGRLKTKMTYDQKHVPT